MQKSPLKLSTAQGDIFTTGAIEGYLPIGLPSTSKFLERRLRCQRLLFICAVLSYFAKARSANVRVESLT